MAQRRRGQPDCFPQGSGQRPGGSPGQGIGAAVVVTASTGNAGAALAGMAAAAQQPAVVFAPKNAPPAKVAQMLVFGARVVLVDGSYDQASALSRQAAEELGWYCRNTGYNPFTAEGKKTAALEIWSALETGEIRTHHARPLVDLRVWSETATSSPGCTRGSGTWRAWAGSRPCPALYGVQAEGSAAIARAFRSGSSAIEAVRAQTLADSISVDMPADGCAGPAGGDRHRWGVYHRFRRPDPGGDSPLLGRRAYFPNLPPQPPTPA